MIHDTNSSVTEPNTSSLRLTISAAFKHNYFYWASLFLLILSIVAFSDNLFFDVKQESNNDPKFIIHGLFFLAWFIVLVIQSRHISKRNYKTHISIGIAGMFIALGVALSTFYVFVTVYQGWDAMQDYVKANRIFTVSFVLLVYLAYVYRKVPALHKRLLFVGTIYVLGPVIDRAAGKLGIESELNFIMFEVAIWNGLFISLFIYDWLTARKIQMISWMGFIWFYCVWVLASLV